MVVSYGWTMTVACGLTADISNQNIRWKRTFGHDHVVQQAAASMCRRLYVLSEIVCRQNRVIFVSFWVQRSLQMDIHVSRDGDWNRHTGECCQQCGKLVEERRHSWLRTRPVYNDEDVTTASRSRPTAHILKRRRLLPNLNLG